MWTVVCLWHGPTGHCYMTTSINKPASCKLVCKHEIFCFDCDESRDATYIREFDVIRNGVCKGKQATASAHMQCIYHLSMLSKAWREKMSFVWYYLTVNGVLLRYAQRQDYFTVADPETELKKIVVFTRVRSDWVMTMGQTRVTWIKHQKQGIIQSVAWELNQTCLTWW